LKRKPGGTKPSRAEERFFIQVRINRNPAGETFRRETEKRSVVLAQEGETFSGGIWSFFFNQLGIEH